MKPKQLVATYARPYLQTIGVSLSRVIRSSFAVATVLVAFDVSLATAAFGSVRSNTCSYIASKPSCSDRNSSFAIRRISPCVHAKNSPLMLRRLQLVHKPSARLFAMPNRRKRMSSHLPCIPENTKKFATSLESDIQQQYRPLVIVLAGPTAVGKSDVAAELCSSETATDVVFHHRQAQLNPDNKIQLKTRGHVISADSVQVYRGVDIGANKPSIQERERTPHHLVDIVDPPNHDVSSQDDDDVAPTNDSKKVSSYNAADWMRDAEYIIKKLTLFDGNEVDGKQANECLDDESVTRRKCINSFLSKSLENDGSLTPKQPVLPVVVGGTMMYLTWLVHGRPDAIRPTDEAVKRAADAISGFQIGSGKKDKQTEEQLRTPEQEDADDEQRWARASEHVSSLGPVFASRVAKLCGRDWYRLRRLLEVAYTLAHSKIKSPPREESNLADESMILKSLTDAEVYTGIRSGSLSDVGFDVRCFFLCPNERMLHFHTVDQRCETMLMKGLLKETATLYNNGGLPSDSQVTRAIGYRQALEYLLRKDAKMNDAESFLSFVDDFATATRQYAKKQMQWFRKDAEFVFIPVDMECTKEERVKQAANYIADMCKLSRDDFEAQLCCTNDEDIEQLSLSAHTKLVNEQQGKGMKFFISRREKLVTDSVELADAIEDADKCTKLLQQIQ